MNLSYTLFIATLIIMTLFSILNHNYIQMYLKNHIKKEMKKPISYNYCFNDEKSSWYGLEIHLDPYIF